MDAFPKDGPIAKAIVYFVISKLNNIYEQLPKQAVNDDYVQIRHFTIIDEAHYMLDFKTWIASRVSTSISWLTPSIRW